MMKAALGSSPIITYTRTRVWEALFANRPTVYVCVVVFATLVSYAYWLRTQSIFSCQADGYSVDRYVSYCNGESYGDYDHGAFYFDLEPAAQQFAKDADVLFLGNSRLQIAFSTAATADWFAGAKARYYLLGFGYFENMVFAEQLLRRIRPRAGIYVVNVDDFFSLTETAPVKTILHDPAARSRYEAKRFWQQLHQPICQTIAGICGHDYAIFRSRETGAYNWRPVNRKVTPVSYDQDIDTNKVKTNIAAAVDFLSQIAKEKCVILTMVPTVDTKIGSANGVAKALGVNLMTPGILEDLRTFDGSHLDQPSAQRWSQAFFEAAGPTIRSCLNKQGTRHS
jgi:hypothetical protein